ncbi:hypothetical protein SARC_03416 [Sphaeroforma arctica JP610]|uniref:C2H2-type domain-containing protein n=1 Tax=Sphaeroforma arctica JP610 TaxID=667725 RepID=A0A0L0G681_9EUKA|nr:hypothetical protein SARC_03416 [Sphaeroforma arctica JP610]KNC84371.1 hypothetical protein SARC_03416 [Sphaeroforma arctica JP610]|eukprot:XP_014158273.1 hypothetical protein SARC_03416 [Sphaeroforma arctica JP610]
MSASQGQMHTCVSCRVAFPSQESQRTHYRNDWHRYNLKRKVVNLPPVTAENFNARIEAKKAEAAAAEAEALLSGKCVACNKTYASKNQLANHKTSKKHKEAVVEYELKQAELKNNPVPEAKNSTHQDGVGEDDDDEDIEDVEEFELEVTDCLFCSAPHDSLEDNVQHMALSHSFFIPDAEYLIDLEGLINYLGLKITEGNLCLFCADHKEFRSARAVRSHMNEKGHTMLAYHDDCFDEYEDYYDFSSSYPDYDENNPRGDEEVLDNTIQINENDELVLPSGKKIGHRDFNVYYKQNQKPGTEVVIGGSNASGKVKKNNHQLMIGQQVTKGGNAMQISSMVEKNERAKRVQKKERDNWYLKIGMSANNQKHFRLQNPM